MFKKRLISSLILIPLFILAIFFLSIFNFYIIMIIICMISAWEWSKLSKIISKKQRIYVVAIYGIFLTFISCIFFVDNSKINTLQMKNIFLILNFWWIIALFLVIFYPKSSIFWKNSKILSLLYGTFIITPFFLGTIILRQYNYNIDHFTGSWLLIFSIVPVCCLDSGAYIFGKLYGKNKMSPKISPYKTWEGLIGGLITSIIIIFLMQLIFPINKINKSYIIVSLFITILISILGDLTTSIFKRSAGIKNTSNIIPGHGGILDRIDSLTSAIPIFTYLILILK